MKTLTREEFEAKYAANSGLSVEQCRALGMRPEPCDCDSNRCHGWQMVTQPSAEERFGQKNATR